MSHELPNDPLQQPRSLAEEIALASVIVDALVDARSAGPKQYHHAVRALTRDHLEALVELLMIRETGVVELAERRRRRRRRPWLWPWARWLVDALPVLVLVASAIFVAVLVLGLVALR